VLLVALAVACGGEEEETPTGTGTGTPTGTGTAVSTGTAAATPTTGASATAAASPTGGKLYGKDARAATIVPGPPPGITDTEILLGAECILSGTLGAVYATVPKATKAYFDYINDTQGGVCGRKIVYKIEDNGDDPAKALEAARKLVEQDKVFAMVGSLGDGPHPGSWDWLNQHGVPDILVSAGGARFGADPSGHPWEVQMIPSYTIDGIFLGQYISEYHAGDTVAVLWENDTVGVDGFAGVKQGIDPSKNQIVADQSYEFTAISVASEVTNLAKSNAGVFVVNGNLGFIAQAIKTADRLGWHPQIVGPYITADDLMFQFVSPTLMKGMVATDANKLASQRDTDPAVAQHYEIMQKYGGPSPSNFTMYAQILGEIAVDILSRSCDNLTREGLMEAVESTTDFHSDLMLDGVNISFSPTDHVGFQSSRYLEAKVDANGKGYWEYFGPVREFQGESIPGGS
jgi:branched-chain amino acid transport system substrate-binding protein